MRSSIGKESFKRKTNVYAENDADTRDRYVDRGTTFGAGREPYDTCFDRTPPCPAKSHRHRGQLPSPAVRHRDIHHGFV